MGDFKNNSTKAEGGVAIDAPPVSDLAIASKSAAVVIGFGSARASVFPTASVDSEMTLIPSTTKSTGTRLSVTSLLPTLMNLSIDGAMSRY